MSILRIEGLGFGRSEEGQGLARVVEDEVLEVLVVRHGEHLISLDC